MRMASPFGAHGFCIRRPDGRISETKDRVNESSAMGFLLLPVEGVDGRATLAPARLSEEFSVLARFKENTVQHPDLNPIAEGGHARLMREITSLILLRTSVRTTNRTASKSSLPARS
jgi:hypothetical protein